MLTAGKCLTVVGLVQRFERLSRPHLDLVINVVLAVAALAFLMVLLCHRHDPSVFGGEDLYPIGNCSSCLSADLTDQGSASNSRSRW